VAYTVREIPPPGPGVKDPKPPKEPRQRGPLLVWLGFLGVWLAILAFWPPFWAVNGGYSVMGLEIVAKRFNEAGALAWEWLSLWTFRVPIRDLPGLNETQPVLPWVGVLAATILQVVIVAARLLNVKIPPILWVAGIALSLYDVVTTFFGLGTVGWIRVAGIAVQGLIAVLLTFTGELAVGVLVKNTVAALRRRG
jgi:hypothetical protein